MAKRIENLDQFIGAEYGYLTIKSIVRVKSILYVTAMCKCGNLGKYRLAKLKNSHTRSCGCLHKEFAFKKCSIHGMHKTRLNSIWNGMLDRCRRKNNSAYKHYGARGITVCKEWASGFINFYTWAMANGYKDDLSIERVDVNGNYDPSNCRWATKEEQALNKTTSHFITYNGVTKTVTEWARDIGMNYNTLLNRINTYKWPIEKAMTEPI